MAQVNRKVRVALELFLDEELKAVTGSDYKTGCAQLNKLVNKLKEAGEEYQKVTDYLDMTEEEKQMFAQMQKDCR